MKVFLLIITVLCSSLSFSQTGRVMVDQLENLIKEKEFSKLESIAKTQYRKFKEKKVIDSMITYAYYEGIAITNLKGLTTAKSRLLSIIENDIDHRNSSGEQIVNAYLICANLLSYEGDNKSAYSLMEKLKKNTILKEKIKDLQYRIESTMGTFSMRLGNYINSSNHYRESLKLFPPEKIKSDEYFIALNSMGIAMYQASKLDSSIYYFVEANVFLKNLEQTPVNKYFRTAMLYSNISNVYAEKGETNKSNEYAEVAIEKYRIFLNTKESYPQKPGAKRSLFYTMDNLATTLLESGDYFKAKNLYNFSLAEKQKLLGKDDPEVYKSYIALAGVSLSRNETARAINYADQALSLIMKTGDTLTKYEGEVYSKLAQAWYQRGDIGKASDNFYKAYKIFEILNGNEFSVEYLDFLNKYARFNAHTNNEQAAKTLADKSLSYSLSTNNKYSLPVAMQLLNEQIICLQLKKYHVSLDYAQKAIQTFDHLIKNASTALDSVRFESFKVSAVLGSAKSQYYLLKDKNQKSIQQILDHLSGTADMFERRRLFYSKDEDISYTIEAYKDINDFINELQLELYRITDDKSYLDSIIKRNESLVYNRIKRAINNKQINIQFKGVPDLVQLREREIKVSLENALKNNHPVPGSVNSYFKESEKWDAFLNMLQVKYPEYYKVKYAANPGNTITNYSSIVPKGAQVIRFYVINQNVYALILSQTEKHWLALKTKGLSGIIEKLKSAENDIQKTGLLTYELYRQLWDPIEPFINQKKITIIPEGVIYNISFDMLTSRPIKNSREFIEYSLLKKYAFSYQYSLDALNQNHGDQNKYTGISVFAPSFSETEKEKYKTALQSDSIKIDKSYLTLLPLPFSSMFASKLKKEFDSKVYLGHESTISNFKINAGNHSIIYIGTHAESNNQFPEYSRMVFAKDLDKPTADNSLFLYDIYNQNLNAEMSVLTACETGQSNFFPGEGMISMAHAFSYAGSKSILTGLWKIDERASIMITDIFYKNLADGMSKDIALQQAKLSYLEIAYGRMLAPQYWAGLVIMGDTSPIEFQKSKTTYYLWGAGMLLLGISVFYFVRKRRRPLNKDSNK